VEQELLTLPEHLGSTSVFKWGSCGSIFGFLCSVLMIIICPIYSFVTSISLVSINEILIGTASSRISDQLRDIQCTPYTAGMLLHINGKFTMRKLK
jgi:hypothetical protein